MNMFIEFILLFLAYNLHAHVIQIWCVHSWHALMHLQTVVYTSSAYTRALYGRFDVINLVCTRMLALMWNEKRVVSSPYCTCVLSSLWAVPYVVSRKNCICSYTTSLSKACVILQKYKYPVSYIIIMYIHMYVRMYHAVIIIRKYYYSENHIYISTCMVLDDTVITDHTCVPYTVHLIYTYMNTATFLACLQNYYHIIMHN